MITETAIHLGAPSPAGDLCLCPQEVRGLAGMVQCHMVGIQGDGTILHCPPPGVCLAPSRATLTPPPSHPVREGQAIQMGGSRTLPHPRDTRPGNDPHLLYLPPLQSCDWKCPSRVRALHPPGYSLSASASVSTSIHTPSPTAS